MCPSTSRWTLAGVTVRDLTCDCGDEPEVNEVAPRRRRSRRRAERRSFRILRRCPFEAGTGLRRLRRSKRPILALGAQKRRLRRGFDSAGLFTVTITVAPPCKRRSSGRAASEPPRTTRPVAAGRRRRPRLRRCVPQEPDRACGRSGRPPRRAPRPASPRERDLVRVRAAPRSLRTRCWRASASSRRSSLPDKVTAQMPSADRGTGGDCRAAAIRDGASADAAARRSAARAVPARGFGPRSSGGGAGASVAYASAPAASESHASSSRQR